MAKGPTPWYYAVNDRPCMVVDPPTGGSDVLVLDWETGALLSEPNYIFKISDVGPGKDVDSFTKEQFDRSVAELRSEIADKWIATKIVWEHTGDGEIPYRAVINGKTFTLRVNDFPAEPLYSLLVEDQVIVHLEDWPALWVRPEVPQELLDLVEKKRKP